MIDKLEIRVPAMTAAGRELEPIYDALARGVPVPGFRPSQHYCYTGDLRPYGIPAIAHLSCKHGKAPNHKLEFLETGAIGFNNLLATAEQLFHFDPLTAEVMRLDLCADVQDVPVSWFEYAVHAAYKRHVCDIGKMECTRIGKAEVETIYFGKRPNCIRIYNKTAERREQYRELQRVLGRTACALPFQLIYQTSETAVLTRVERQIGAGRIPVELSMVGDLRRHACDFNPFKHLRINSGLAKLPTPQEVGLSMWLQGMKLRDLALQSGLHRLRRFLTQHSKGNAARMLAQFAAFLSNSEDEGVTDGRLNAIYRESVQKQLAA